MLHLLNNFRCNLKIGSIIRSSEIRRSDPLPYLGKGQNYKNYNVENQKEHQKIWRWSLHRNVSFSWSLLRHQYYDKKKDFRRCDFTYGIKKDHNVENQKCLFKQLPMAYYLWIPRPVGPWGGGLVRVN